MIRGNGYGSSRILRTDMAAPAIRCGLNGVTAARAIPSNSGGLADVPVVDADGRGSDRDEQNSREHQDDRRVEVVLEMFGDEVADVSN